MVVYRNGKPIDETEFERGEPERAAAMRKWHAERRVEERAPSHAGLNNHWNSPRVWKHNRKMRIGFD